MKCRFHHQFDFSTYVAYTNYEGSTYVQHIPIFRVFLPKDFLTRLGPARDNVQCVCRHHAVEKELCEMM